MREGFEIISGGKTGRMFLFGAVIALAATLAVTLATKNGHEYPTASANSLSAPSSAPAEAAYIKIGDIKGESTDDGHEDWIEVESFSHSIAVPTVLSTGSARAAGKASVRDFVITKHVDKSTPLLMKAALSGQRIPVVEFELATNSGEAKSTPYLKYELKDVLITNYRTSGSGSGDPLPTESISLNFAQIKVTYIGQNPDGSAASGIEMNWDVAANKAQ